MLTFREVFEAELPYVHRTVRRLGVRERDAEDVTQEVFLRVHARLSDYDSSQPLRPWLFAFARGVVANHLRLARHREIVTDEPGGDDPAGGHDPESHTLGQERRARVLRALAALRLELREVVVMHDLDGFTAPEISAALDVPLNTVYSRIRTARAELRAALPVKEER